MRAQASSISSPGNPFEGTVSGPTPASAGPGGPGRPSGPQPEPEEPPGGQTLTSESGVRNIVRSSMSTGRREEGARTSNSVFNTPRASCESMCIWCKDTSQPFAKGSAAYAAPATATATTTDTATTARQQQPALACVFILVGNQENVS